MSACRGRGRASSHHWPSWASVRDGPHRSSLATGRSLASLLRTLPAAATSSQCSLGALLLTSITCIPFHDHRMTGRHGRITSHRHTLCATSIAQATWGQRGHGGNLRIGFVFNRLHSGVHDMAWRGDHDSPPVENVPLRWNRFITTASPFTASVFFRG